MDILLFLGINKLSNKMESEDLKANMTPKAENHSSISNDAVEIETVSVKKLPVKEFAKLIHCSPPKKKTLVSKFEGFFYW